MASYIERRFPALQSVGFRRLLIGQMVSASGSMMQMAALNWQIYDLTGSPAALGAIGLVRVIPIILFSLLGGAVADMQDRRKLLLITQTNLAMVAFLLSALAFTHHTTIWSIYALTAVGAAAIAFDNPARQALIPMLVPVEHRPNAFALGSTAFQVATVAGPVLAGYTLKHLGAGWAYFLNGFSFVAILIPLFLMPPQLPERPEGSDQKPTKITLASLKEGIAFVTSTPILIATMLLDFFATFFSSANALLPIFAKDILKVGPDGFGILSAFPAVGSLIAGVTLSLLPPVKEQGKVLLLAVVCYGLATIAFGFSSVFWVSALTLAGTGVADTVSTVLRQTIRQTVTPDHLRGRAISINMLFFMGGPQLGELEAGLVAKWFGAPFSVVSGGIACILATAVVAMKMPFLSNYRLSDTVGVLTETGAEKRRSEEDRPQRAGDKASE